MPVPPGSDDASIRAAFDRLEALLQFPADYPLKVMGRRVDEFAQTITQIASQHVPEFDPAGVELRLSSGGQYISVTLNLRVHSRQQLEALYRELAAHPLVKVVL